MTGPKLVGAINKRHMRELKDAEPSCFPGCVMPKGQEMPGMQLMAEGFQLLTGVDAAFIVFFR